MNAKSVRTGIITAVLLLPTMIMVNRSTATAATLLLVVGRDIYLNEHTARACTIRCWTPFKTPVPFGDTPLKFQVVCPELSPKRDCSPKSVNTWGT